MGGARGCLRARGRTVGGAARRHGHRRGHRPGVVGPGSTAGAPGGRAPRQRRRVRRAVVAACTDVGRGGADRTDRAGGLLPPCLVRRERRAGGARGGRRAVSRRPGHRIAFLDVKRRWKIAAAVVAVIALLLAVNTIVTNSETKPAKADGGRIVTLPGGDLQVREDGSADKPPVVLIHGWTASLHWFDRITPLLAGSYRVIRVDLLGHGGSAKPKDGYSMEEQADRVAAALVKVGVRRALVAGHSTGGEVDRARGAPP